MHELNRIALTSISTLLKHFPCVVVLGARQVGKTTLLRQSLPKAPFFDLEKTSDREKFERDPDFFLSQFKESIVIDEAQTLPTLFPALRVAIDSKRHKNGQYLLSGSSSPHLTKHLHESLAGRIAIFELSTLSLEEAWKLPPSPFYSAIVEKKPQKLFSLKSRLSRNELFESCFFGLYPEPFLRKRKNPQAFSLWMENYYRTYIDRDVRPLFPGLNFPVFTRFVQMLSSAHGQMLNASEFARSLDVSVPTIKSYFQIAEGTFVWRMLPSYHQNVSKRVIKMPKGHMRDSGLTNFLLNNFSKKDFLAHPISGRIWEAFVIEELIKGFQNQLIAVKPYFYRTSHQAEIDLILEGQWGLLPIEIKFGTVTDSKKLRSLADFIEEHRLHYGLMLNNSESVEWLSPKILQIPVGFL